MRALVVLALCLSASVAHAHDASPGVLGLEELEDGRFLVGWSLPVDTRYPSADRVAPRFPAHCRREGSLLDCGARGLDTIAIDGLEGTRMRVAVVVSFRDAPPLEAMAEDGTSEIAAGAGGSSFGRWVALGIEHVLLGLDHLAFLLGLLFVSRLDRRLLLTITAFTLAHSLTLALAVLDVLRPSSALVEALIALSVLLVAREGLSEAPSLVRRAPWPRSSGSCTASGSPVRCSISRCRAARSCPRSSASTSVSSSARSRSCSRRSASCGSWGIGRGLRARAARSCTPSGSRRPTGSWSAPRRSWGSAPKRYGAVRNRLRGVRISCVQSVIVAYHS
jgi:hydrogenase/urease accessory protein HupE